MKDTTDTRRTASYLNLLLNIDTDGRLYTKIYKKRDDHFNFPIINFPFLSSNTPSVPSYGVYISQLRCYVMLVHVHTIRTSYTGMCFLRKHCSYKVMRRKYYKWHSVNFMDTITNWLIHTICLCN